MACLFSALVPWEVSVRLYSETDTYYHWKALAVALTDFPSVPQTGFPVLPVPHPVLSVVRAALLAVSSAAVLAVMSVRPEGQIHFPDLYYFRP